MSHPYGQLDRPPLSERALTAALIRPGALWTSVTVVPETGSTNADLLVEAGRGAAGGTVLVAEAQTAGRGRLDRNWVSPPRAGLLFSMLLRPVSVPRPQWSWLPLLVGVALAEAVEEYAGVEPELKWPNDLLLGQAKAAGILAQASADAVVVGVGLNVLTRLAELPPGATSLAAVGAERFDRDPMLRATLRSVEKYYRSWEESGGDALASGLRAAYRQYCDTLGRAIVVTLPQGQPVQGVASEIDATGRLVVDDGSQKRAFAVGDVTHVRSNR